MIIFLLLLIGIVLVVLNIKAVKNDKTNFKTILETNMDDDLSGIYKVIDRNKEEYIVELKELKNKINILEQQIMELKEEKNSKRVEKTEVKKVREENVKNEIEKNTNNNGLYIDKVREFLDKGMTIEEIAENLKIGKGEVLLVKELYLK